MNKFIPYEKLSKKEKRKIDLSARRSWNGVNPVTRKTANPKAYNRNKSRRLYDDPDFGIDYCLRSVSVFKQSFPSF